MTWSEFKTFLWGSTVVLIDAVTGPLYRHIHQRSKK